MTRSFTFYSYKGGSGRTTVLLNTVRHLVDVLGADPEHPILLVDADLESAGLTFYFEMENKFWGDLSANKIFTRPKVVLAKDQQDIVLNGIENPNTYVECEKTTAWKTIEEFCKLDREKDVTFADLLSDTYLPGQYFGFLKKYLANILEREGNSGRKGASVDPPIFALKDRLRKISNESKSKEECIKRKSEALRDFLPTRSFMDVTKYFYGDRPLAPGTIKFLGTDVSTESRVPGNEGAACINMLLDVCSDDKYPYSAVLFDSGSGTQASAYMLHQVSEVIVYCMRPTIQFIKGTRENILRFEKDIQSNLDEYPRENNGKPIILFPNAVPNLGDDECFRKVAFEKIQGIAKRFDRFIDPTFCEYDASLHEVPLFKWHEKILGCTDFHQDPNNDILNKEIDRYSHDDLPDEVKTVDEVYRNLAKRLKDNN